MTSERHRLLAILWLAIVLAFAVALLLIWPRATLNSSVMSLLPALDSQRVPAAIERGFTQRLDRQLVWLVRAPDKATGSEVATDWLQRVRGIVGIGEVEGPLDDRWQQRWGLFAWQHRNALVDSATRARLQQGAQAQADWILSQLYSAFAGVGRQELQRDPLLLVRSAQLALQQQGNRLILQNGWLVAKDDSGASWYFLHAELNAPPDDMQRAHRIADALRLAQQQLQQRWPGAQLLTRGSLFFSDFASQQAQHDITRLGTGTVVGVLLLVFLVFRSLRPLLLCVLSVSIGALVGLVATLLLFGEMHLMTLVMSISITGISADYTLYYLTERRVHGADLSPLESLGKVARALLLALATTVMAYLIMLLAPFPGLRQLAVFAAAGLTASCLTVVCWYPLLVKGLPVRPLPYVALMGRWLVAWRRKPALRLGLPLAVLVVSAIGWSRLHINDDISQLQALPPALLAQDRQVASLTGQQGDQRWFLVSAAQPQEALQRLEQLTPLLQQAQQKRWLASYRLLPLPSLAQQQRSLALLRQQAPQVASLLQQAGISIGKPDLSAMTLMPQAWLAAPNSSGWRLLWLSLKDGRSAVLVPVSGVGNSAALAGLAQQVPGVAWIDRKASFDKLFGFYRQLLCGLLLAALGAIGLSYLIRLGVRQGMLSMVPSCLSLAAGLAALGYSGQPLNLFSLLALVLVLGIGINYTLFFSNPRGTPLTSLLAVTLAMTTTLLTLGMLVFSQTAAIAGFGLVLCCGIMTAWLLAPLAIPGKRRKP